jgi:sodium/pantothenate symporter
MSSSLLAWSVVILYVAVIAALAVRGARRTSGVDSYAVGNRDLPATLVGLALTAQLTSVATFVINPGLVFHAGISALVGYGLAAGLGITLGLIVFSARFRAVGSRVAALTLPQWIGSRFDSPLLRGIFATLSLGLVAYAVLIVVALSLVLGNLLGVAPTLVAVALTVFAVSTVAFGGANGHAWTGAAQAVVMLAVAVLLVVKGLPSLLDGSLVASLRTADPALLGVTNPGSHYFRTLFEVLVCNFLVGAALVCQPHIVSKVLFLRDDKQVRTYLTTAVLGGTVFLCVLVTGLYARAVVPLDTRIDLVIPTWIATAFSPGLQVVITVGLLCAGLSTLEGILLALGSMLSIDVHPAWRRLTGADPSRALRFGRVGLAVLGLVTVALAWRQLADPVGGSVAIFAQYGVYLLFTGAFVPLAAGMFSQTVSRGAVTAAALAAIGTYLAAATWPWTPLASNPAVLATFGMMAGWGTLIGVEATARALAGRRTLGAGSSTGPATGSAR